MTFQPLPRQFDVALSVDGEFNRLAKILFTFLLVQIPLQDSLERSLRLVLRMRAARPRHAEHGVHANFSGNVLQRQKRLRHRHLHRMIVMMLVKLQLQIQSLPIRQTAEILFLEQSGDIFEGLAVRDVTRRLRGVFRKLDPPGRRRLLDRRPHFHGLHAADDACDFRAFHRHAVAELPHGLLPAVRAKLHFIHKILPYSHVGYDLVPEDRIRRRLRLPFHKLQHRLAGRHEIRSGDVAVRRDFSVLHMGLA